MEIKRCAFELAVKLWLNPNSHPTLLPSQPYLYKHPSHTATNRPPFKIIIVDIHVLNIWGDGDIKFQSWIVLHCIAHWYNLKLGTQSTVKIADFRMVKMVDFATPWEIKLGQFFLLFQCETETYDDWWLTVKITDVEMASVWWSSQNNLSLCSAWLPTLHFAGVLNSTN